MSIEINVIANDEALGYLREVASEMVLLFGLSLEEAAGRLNQSLAGRQFLTSIEVNVLLHEDQETWAKHIYFGRDSCWWLSDARPTPLPWP